MQARLQKILSQRGVASRRKAEELLKAGRVTCNGRVCGLGDSADPDTDEILLDGKPLPTGGAYIYLMLHKPRGYVTTLSDEKGRKTAASLVADCGIRVYPVGRLDMDSEGLLLFTNDGEFANLLMHPRHLIDKTYRVTVTGFTPPALMKLARPVELDGYRIQPPGITLENAAGDKATILVTIHEGRNRQVRRMCALAGLTVQRLVRIREGKLSLGTLKCGTWRYLSEEEIAHLRGDRNEP